MLRIIIKLVLFLIFRSFKKIPGKNPAQIYLPQTYLPYISF